MKIKLIYNISRKAKIIDANSSTILISVEQFSATRHASRSICTGVNMI